jgi:hypothetical protein
MERKQEVYLAACVRNRAKPEIGNQDSCHQLPDDLGLVTGPCPWDGGNPATPWTHIFMAMGSHFEQRFFSCFAEDIDKDLVI